MKDKTLTNETLRDCVEKKMTQFFHHLEGQSATDIYNMVILEVELPLLKSVMEYTKGNQSKASKILGLNRGTLRKKLKQHSLL